MGISSLLFAKLKWSRRHWRNRHSIYRPIIRKREPYQDIASKGDIFHGAAPRTGDCKYRFRGAPGYKLDRRWKMRLFVRGGAAAADGKGAAEFVILIWCGTVRRCHSPHLNKSYSRDLGGVAASTRPAWSLVSYLSFESGKSYGYDDGLNRRTYTSPSF